MLQDDVYVQRVDLHGVGLIVSHGRGREDGSRKRQDQGVSVD